MADNVPITAGTGTSIATDDVGGVQFQRVKPAVGADGSATDVSAAAPMPSNVTDGTKHRLGLPGDVPADDRRTAPDVLRPVRHGVGDHELLDGADDRQLGGCRHGHLRGDVDGHRHDGVGLVETVLAGVVPVADPGWLGFSFAITIPDLAAPTANSYRFWGSGTPATTPTTTAPMTDAVGFEIRTDGKMYAVIYAGGSRTVIQDLSAATGNSTQPTNASAHRYIVYVRTDRAYWYIDGLASANLVANFVVPVADHPDACRSLSSPPVAQPRRCRTVRSNAPGRWCGTPPSWARRCRTAPTGGAREC
jgi:hypothetical protein